jgi:hypothetical protein
VYEDDTDVSFKIGRTSFKYNDKNLFVDGKKNQATPGLWELLSRSKPDKTWSLFMIDKHINKYYCSLMLI